ADAVQAEEALRALAVVRAGIAAVGSGRRVAGAAAERSDEEQEAPQAFHGPSSRTKLTQRASLCEESRARMSCWESNAVPASSTWAATTSPSGPSAVLALSPMPCPAPPDWL